MAMGRAAIEIGQRAGAIATPLDHLMTRHTRVMNEKRLALFALRFY
jgi:hypothetical protein